MTMHMCPHGQLIEQTRDCRNCLIEERNRYKAALVNLLSEAEGFVYGTTNLKRRCREARALLGYDE